MDSELLWGLVSWGHGIFQSCEIHPFLFQLDEDLAEEEPISVIAEHYLLIGVEFRPPTNYEYTLTEFQQQFKAHAASLELTYQIFKGVEEVFLENRLVSSSSYTGSATMNRNSLLFTEKSLIYTKKGLIIFTQSYLKVATKYLNTPLQLLVSLNVITNQVKPFNQRQVMDPTELDVRLLLDLNRFRPPKIPSRKLVSSIIIMQPLEIMCRSRALDGGRVIAIIEFENKHPTRSVRIDDFKVFFDHSKYGDDETPVVSTCGDSFSSIVELKSSSDRIDDSRRSEASISSPRGIIEEYYSIKSGSRAFSNAEKPLDIKPFESYSLCYEIHSQVSFHKTVGSNTPTVFERNFITPIGIRWYLNKRTETNAANLIGKEACSELYSHILSLLTAENDQHEKIMLKRLPIAVGENYTRNDFIFSETKVVWSIQHCLPAADSIKFQALSDGINLQEDAAIATNSLGIQLEYSQIGRILEPVEMTMRITNYSSCALTDIHVLLCEMNELEFSRILHQIINKDGRPMDYMIGLSGDSFTIHQCCKCVAK